MRPNGKVEADTRFQCYQQGSIVWAEYFGSSIVEGSLITECTGRRPSDMRTTM